MWGNTWKYREGFTIGAGLTISGILLQATIGRVEWDFFASPVNLISLIVYIGLMTMMHLLRNKVQLFNWLGSVYAAVTSIACASVLTVVMGLIRQVPSAAGDVGFPGLSQMLSNWSFVLVYIWLMTSLFMAVLRVCVPLRWRRVPFLLNHLGLFIALTCGVLGSADLQRLTMQVTKGNPEWRATDGSGRVLELPITVELKDFCIDLYPPGLLLVDIETGESLSEPVLIDDGVEEFQLGDWQLRVLSVLPDAAPVINGDSVSYVESHATGACAAVCIEAVKADATVRDWVSCGSYAFSYKDVRLDSTVSVVMPDPEPKRYVSVVSICTKSGRSIADTIQVNHPSRIEGWKIYQLGYDESMGRWSEASVFEIVRDPWMPAVYVGVIMLIAGAVCMFVQTGRKKDDLQ